MFREGENRKGWSEKSCRKFVALTGTPGTGKTEVSRLLEQRGFRVLHLNDLVREKSLHSGFDTARKCLVVDMKIVADYLKENPTDFDVIESHLSHLLPDELISGVIVLRCEPETLKKRLEKKGWDAEKIRENVEAEMIDLIAWESRQKHENVVEIDTTFKTPETVAEEVGKYINKFREKN
ncbi:MAG: AAA family ATPase [Candidatus Micrarchaeota archaeon]|nr:AAA family ATPase [Candidatus Micrarchaeota archaeon]